MREEREPLKDELVVVKLDDGGAVGEEVGGGGHGHAVVVEAGQVVAGRVTRVNGGFPGENVVADPAPSVLDAAATERAVVHLARVVVPQFRVEA